MEIPIRSRLELARHLQTQMAAARSPWALSDEDDAEPQGRTWVKTYLLEAHANHNGDQSTGAFLRGLLPNEKATVFDSEEGDLFRIRSGLDDYWCDTSLGRYWRLHTVAKVRIADRFRDSLVSSTPFLDNVWLPPLYLESLASRTDSVMQTFSMSHDRRSLRGSDRENDDFDYVALRLFASSAGKTLNKLRDTGLFPHGLSIRSVRLRSNVDSPDEETEFCVAEYFHNGKISVNGTSFGEHNRMLLRVLHDYRILIERIEQEYAIGWDRDGDHLLLRGNPVVIEMEWTVRDLEYVVRKMFSATDPFRLWGVPERVSEDHYRARAVDLHVGSTLSFDITKRHIVVQLPVGTCGNTIIRFLAALHYHVNADVGTDLLEWTGDGDTHRSAERSPCS